MDGLGVREERSQGQDWEGETVCGRWNGWKLSAGFGIGRVELSGEDGMVGWVLRVLAGLGGWNCIGRVEWVGG